MCLPQDRGALRWVQDVEQERGNHDVEALVGQGHVLGARVDQLPA